MDKAKSKVLQGMFKAFPHLEKLKMNEFNRKFLIEGDKLAGKTKTI